MKKIEKQKLQNTVKENGTVRAEGVGAMIMYKIFFEIISNKTDADIISTFESVNREVMNDCEYKYHTDKENQQDTILDNARELLSGYAFGRYIKPVVEAVYISE